MLLGVVGNPPRGMDSEREALERIHALAMEIIEGEGLRSRGGARARQIANIALKMMRQLHRGVHVNPRSRGERGGKMSDHVQAIVYVHEEDGEFYVHGFGDAKLDLSVKRGTLCIEGLKDRTHVQMFAEPDGSVSIVGRDGQRLWEDFD